MARIELLSQSAADTYRIGTEFGKRLLPDSVVCFFGDLGAGKTTFIKGVVAGASGISGEEVSSPTFTYLNIYRGSKTLYHFDLYRLRNTNEFLSMGFDEMFDAGGICCIEWAEKLLCNSHVLPERGILSNAIFVRFSYEGLQGRLIEISKGSS